VPEDISDFEFRLWDFPSTHPFLTTKAPRTPRNPFVSGFYWVTGPQFLIVFTRDNPMNEEPTRRKGLVNPWCLGVLVVQPDLAGTKTG
jgi:hypothetical protein